MNFETKKNDAYVITASILKIIRPSFGKNFSFTERLIKSMQGTLKSLRINADVTPK